MTILLAVVAAALVALSLAGCPKKKPKGPTCDSNEDCDDGLACIDKKCAPCTSDNQCGDGYKCDSGACVATAACTKDADCEDGKVCKAGKCAPCRADGECGPGGKCAAGACERAKACSQNEDCEDDEDCIDGYCQRPWQASAGGASCQLQTIYFGFDDSSIQQSERDRLDGNAQCIEKNPTKTVVLFGHTDQIGTEEYNIALSERRARAASDYLIRLGVPSALLDVVGKGETELTGQGDDQDRRVEFGWR
jgi:peptidoglycan-associated lipoprotein